MENFKKIFTLNYDLLLYWVILAQEEKKFRHRDGFGKGRKVKNGRFIGPFKTYADCDIYNLHGGLHLFQNDSGEIEKALNTGEGGIANITNEITGNMRLPLYVAEGTSISKRRKIDSIKYLRHCYQKLNEITGDLFVYGHNADENDEHIYDAIFRSEANHVYFGYYKPGGNDVNVYDAKLSNYQKRNDNKVNYSFFDAETADVWAEQSN